MTLAFSHIFAVGVGGGLGAVARLLVTSAIAHKFGTSFPYPTLSVNVLGGLLMGFVAAYYMQHIGLQNSAMRLFLSTGFLGGFTTFSAFSLEMLRLLESGAYAAAFMYALLSVILCVAAVFVGLKIAGATA